MKWFNENGDKVLMGVAATATALDQAGLVNSPWFAAITGIAAILHTVFWPNNPGTPPAPTQSAPVDQKK